MILLGVTGSVSASKSVDILRLLQAYELPVTLILTREAEYFVTPTMAQVFAKRSIYRYEDFFTPRYATLHIDLAQQAQQVLIAPASAQFIAKLAYGFADCLLSAVCLATSAPIILAPSMNTHMWENAATQHNVQILRQRGARILDVDIGPLACGTHGAGRLLDPLQIVQSILPPPILKGKKVVITAGPTREFIDAVRFLSNGSSGKMGFACARAAYQMGAHVTLISGPVHLEPPEGEGISFVPVITSHEMLAEVNKHQDMDIFVSAAAVCDMMPQQGIFQGKMPKENLKTLSLGQTPDILHNVSQWPKPPYTIGFCAQTDNIEAKARAKLLAKKCNMVFANNVYEAMHADDNEGWIITAHETHFVPRQSKSAVASCIFEYAHECAFSHA